MDHKKTSEFIFKILEEAMLEVGEENVLQIITDSASNYVGAGNMIMERFKTIYWTPCVMDLLLHDLGKLPWVNEVIQRGKLITNFVVNHRLTLSIYRKHAIKYFLRSCDTRFTTYYIILNRVVEEKASLRSAVSNEWEKSPLSKTSKGKLVEEIILSNNYWDSVERVLNMCKPIMKMLHLVDGDTPCMGFFYEGMEHYKEAIEKVFNNVIDEYKLIWDMVDFRWKMMNSPLHATSFYLDPKSFGFKRNGDKKIMSGLYEAIEKLNPDKEVVKKVRE
eukprot:Gb_02947 [translate_table: standard]